MSTPGASGIPAVVLTREVGWAAAHSRLRSGAWTRVRRGAYVAPLPAGPAWAAQAHAEIAAMRAVVAGLTSPYVLSHLTAARLHGYVVGTWDGNVHLTRPARHARMRGVRQHIAAVADKEIVEVAGMAVTSPERTILDCLTWAHPATGWHWPTVDCGRWRRLAASNGWSPSGGRTTYGGC